MVENHTDCSAIVSSTEEFTKNVPKAPMHSQQSDLSNDREQGTAHLQHNSHSPDDPLRITVEPEWMLEVTAMEIAVKFRGLSSKKRGCLCTAVRMTTANEMSGSPTQHRICRN
jgi:hypothetical protein